ncbi:MAG TPA: hypothetical protein VFQ60_05310 [Patescibacteria group bacterium]|nr:hypothetical protein [Patescibacteria group bacterium]
MHPLSLAILDIQGEFVTAKTQDGQTWRIPTKAISGRPNVGQSIRFIGSVETDGALEGSLARALINELLEKNPTA